MRFRLLWGQEETGPSRAETQKTPLAERALLRVVVGARPFDVEPPGLALVVPGVLLIKETAGGDPLLRFGGEGRKLAVLRIHEDRRSPPPVELEDGGPAIDP
jgi:hypothetical protein